MLFLPVHSTTTFVLVRPHYPENVGAAARAMKTMGFTRLALVKPSRLALPEHVMAQKMAVKSLDVLDGAVRHVRLKDALDGADYVLGTTSRRGVSGVIQPRAAAAEVVRLAAEERRTALVFGNEKTGLGSEDLELCHDLLRIPMAADQPSINLAQTVQLLAYELLLAALEARRA